MGGPGVGDRSGNEQKRERGGEGAIPHGRDEELA